MKIVVASLMIVASFPLFAQYGPPAKDLEEAKFFVREIARQIEPPLNEARDQLAVLTLVAKVTNRLAGLKPAEEIADGLKMIDDFLERRERMERPLSRENAIAIMSVRTELELQQPPYSNGALRERLHHEFVHPMEREALGNKAKIDALLQQWQMLVMRHIGPFDLELMSAVREVAKEQSVQ
jgi:hypothetical protein